MGCDIHIYLEHKVDGKWILLDHYEKNDKGFLEIQECLDLDRDYDLFAVLADVRNYYDFIPISAPKGLPNDCSHILLQYHEEADYGFHSHSWLTYREILEYWRNLDYKYVEKYGFVTKKDYDFFKLVGRPSSYFGGGGGKSISNEEMEKLDPDNNNSSHFSGPKTLIQWKESYYECVGSELYNILQQIDKIYYTKEQDYDNIRIVFWFDN